MKERTKGLLAFLGLILIWFIMAGIYTSIDFPEKCERRATPVDHAEEYMDIDVGKYDKITYERRNGERFEAIIYEVCE